MSDPVGPLHTSVFVAREADRPPGALSDRVTVSVVTVGELELAVLSTADSALRARRTDTLALARRMDPVPVGEAVICAWARPRNGNLRPSGRGGGHERVVRLVSDCRRAGIQRTAKRTDALIAATAIALRGLVVTQDDDYDQMARAHSPLQVRKV